MKRRGALILLALGIVLAGGASVLVLAIARQANDASRAVIAQVYVVMAAREIPDQGLVTPDALVIRPFPADFAPAGAISNPDVAIGKVAVGTIFKDQILLEGHVSSVRREPSLSDRIPSGKVVIWLPMPELLAGQITLRPGDRLDILLSLQLGARPSGEGVPAELAGGDSKLGTSTQTTLQNVEIFQLGEQKEGGVKAGTEGVNVRAGGSTQPLALLVDHQDAIIIKYIKDSGGVIDLALRSAEEERIVRTDAVTVDSLSERFRFRVPTTLAEARP